MYTLLTGQQRSPSFGLTPLNGFLGIREKPFDATARGACQCRRGPVRPIEVQERHSCRIQLRTALHKSVARAVWTGDRLPSDRITLTGWRLTHRLDSALNRCEERSQNRLLVGFVS